MVSADNGRLWTYDTAEVCGEEHPIKDGRILRGVWQRYMWRGR
jgi:hypothetical protein